MRNKSINLDKILKYIMVLSMLYFSQTGVLTYAKFPQYANHIMVFTFLFIMGVFAVKVVFFKTGIPAWATWWGIICILQYLITMAASADYRAGYILLVMNIFLGIAFSSMYSRIEFYHIFVNCIVWISIVSMISTYILVPFLKDSIPTIKASNDVAPYCDLLLSYPLLYAERYRLNAVWTEPGMFAVYLSFALILALFFTKKERMWKKIVLFLAMIGTRSSAGYIFLVLILGVYFIDEVVNENDIKKMIVLACIMAVGVFVLYVVFTDAADKILSKLDWHSLDFLGRFAPMVYNLDRGMRSPICGWGFQEGMFYIKYSFYTGTLFCNTSTTTQLFHYFGVLIPVFTVIASYLIAGTKKTKWYIKTMLAFILVLSVNFESVVLDQIYTVFLFSIFMKVEGDGYESSLDQLNSNQTGMQSITAAIKL